MRNFLEFIESLAADALCGRGRAVKFGIFLFERDKLIEKLIVFIIRNLRRILDIVKIRMMREQLAKLVYAALCRVFFAFHKFLRVGNRAGFCVFCTIINPLYHKKRRNDRFLRKIIE